MDIDKLKPIKIPKASEEIAAQLKELIIKGEIKPGEKLPSNEELSARFGVGQRSVREALQSLALMGFVEVRRGEGTVVKGVDLNNYMQVLAENIDAKLLSEKNALLQLWEVRSFLEVQIGIAAARRGKEEHLRLMEKHLQKQKEAMEKNDIETFNRSDLEFHQVMVDATNNEILVAIYKALTDLMLESRRRTNQIPGILPKVVEEHEEIFNAIKKRSEKNIREAILKHMNNTQYRIENFLYKDVLPESK
ncbi:FadR family transcriptional regulator [Candidatus Aerophobetes bacterium]|nr:FadR family transcriptional regulator [Candidatus Aerophobetes bacterium]